MLQNRSKQKEQKEKELKDPQIPISEVIELLKGFTALPDTKVIAQDVIDSLAELNKLDEKEENPLVEKIANKIQKYFSNISVSPIINGKSFKTLLFQSSLAIANKWPINPIDVITQDIIEPKNRFVTSDRHQFDITTLVSWINSKGKMTNPITNELFRLEDQEIIKKLAKDRGLVIDPEHPFHSGEDLALLAGAIDVALSGHSLFQPSQQQNLLAHENETIRNILNILNTSHILTLGTRNAVIQNQNYATGILEVLRELSWGNPALITQPNFMAIMHHATNARSFSEGLWHLRNPRPRLIDQENFNDLILSAPYAANYAGALISLHEHHQLTDETRSILHINRQYAHIISDAIIAIQNKIPGNLTVFCLALQQQPEYSLKISEAIRDLEKPIGGRQCNLTQDNFNAIIQHGQYSSEIQKSLNTLNDCKLLTPANRNLIIQKAEHAGFISSVLNQLIDAKIANQDNFNRLIDNAMLAEKIFIGIFEMPWRMQSPWYKQPLNQKSFDSMLHHFQLNAEHTEGEKSSNKLKIG